MRAKRRNAKRAEAHEERRTALPQRRRGAEARDGQVVAVSQRSYLEWLRACRKHASAPLRQSSSFASSTSAHPRLSPVRESVRDASQTSEREARGGARGTANHFVAETQGRRGSGRTGGCRFPTFLFGMAPHLPKARLCDSAPLRQSSSLCLEHLALARLRACEG
jgi:hypothetical protein